jgi:hypothetical protein
LSFQQIQKPISNISSKETKKEKNNIFKDNTKIQDYNQSFISKSNFMKFNFSDIGTYNKVKIIQRKAKCTCGGKCEKCKAEDRLLHIPNIQTKLKISQPGDPLEKEADRVAEQIFSTNHTNRKAGNKNKGKETIDRKCSKCEDHDDTKDKPIQIRSNSNKQNIEFPSEINNEIKNVIRNGGKPLNTQTKKVMEAGFGFDFSNVRIHEDEGASKSASLINALAYTIGNDIVFGERQYQPNTLDGRTLLGHELVHVVQQNGLEENTDIGLSSYKREVPLEISRQSKLELARQQVTELEDPSFVESPTPSVLSMEAAVIAAEAEVSIFSANVATEVVASTQRLTPNQAAQSFANRFSGRLVNDQGLQGIFERTSNRPTLSVERRSAAVELAKIHDKLTNGHNGQTVNRLTVLAPGRTRSPDFILDLANGQTVRVEVRTFTAAPMGHSPPHRPLAAATAVRSTPITQNELETAILNKAKTTPTRPSQLNVPISNVPAGGEISIHSTHRSISVATVDAAIANLQLEPYVHNIKVTFPNSDGSGRITLNYQRQGQIFVRVPSQVSSIISSAGSTTIATAEMQPSAGRSPSMKSSVGKGAAATGGVALGLAQGYAAAHRFDKDVEYGKYFNPSPNPDPEESAFWRIARGILTMGESGKKTPIDTRFNMSAWRSKLRAILIHCHTSGKFCHLEYTIKWWNEGTAPVNWRIVTYELNSDNRSDWQIKPGQENKYTKEQNWDSEAPMFLYPPFDPKRDVFLPPDISKILDPAVPDKEIWGLLGYNPLIELNLRGEA